jgi:heat shock protein HslJ
MSLDFEQRLRAELSVEPVPLRVDEQAVLTRGRTAVRLRAVGRTLAGVAVLAVAIPVVSLLSSQPAAVIPSAGGPAATSGPAQTNPSRSAWRLSAETGKWVGVESAITLVIDRDKVSGDLGCGSYSANVVETATSWRLAQFAVIPCPYPSGSPVPHFLNVLSSVRTAVREADRLTLSGAEGTLVFQSQ